MINSQTDIQWKDGSLSSSTNVKELLENRAHSLKKMENFNLSNANLESINLVNTDAKDGLSLTNSNLYKSNFENAHCFKLNLSGSSLMKANFKNANLHCANLTNCNLLGTEFENAKLENVIWDEQVIQERSAKKAKTRQEAMDYYQQAEEIYRNLRRITEADGLFENAGYFFQKEMQMRRKKMPKFSLQRAISKLVDISCGYGERPLRIISFSLILILIFSIIFFMTGIFYNDALQIFTLNNSLEQNIILFGDCLYFSVVTFTTLGYGDIVPVGITKLFVALEALSGGFILAIFVIVFVKKMTR